MLVLVSFGLVLLATILLIVGLFNDTLGLIYLSIVASVLAAVVLFLAFRMARPKTEKGEAPEPIDPEGMAAAEAASAATTASPAGSATAGSVAAVTPSATGPTDDPDAEPTAVTPAVAATADDDWMDDDEWDDAVVDFPIADYDDLTVAEIMPLLPQLYSDELDTVIERERDGRNRSTIIRRLEDLKVSGTEADLEERGDEDFAPSPPSESGSAPAAQPAPATAPEPPPSTSGFDLGGDDEDFFPIADYDDLTVGQIAPLLDQLEPDELEDVRAREASGGARKTVLAEIDRLLTGGSAPAPPTREPAKPAAPSARSRRPRFPIASYDELTVADIRPRLSDLSDKQLETVLDHERSTSGRSSIINEIERRLGVATAPARKAASRTARTARKAARKPRFPIANYDDLTVADIRPRLSDLSERQLEQVRAREAAGAARKTILKEIDSRLT